MNLKLLIGSALAVGLLLTPRPAAALPRVTLTAKDSSLHEVLSAVRRETGWSLIGPRNEGTEGFIAEAAGRKSHLRASFQWADTSLARVCRDIEKAYGCRHLIEDLGSHRVYFHPPEAIEKETEKPLVTTRCPGAQLEVLQSRQIETRYRLSRDHSERSLRTEISLRVTPDDGDPDAIFGLADLRLTDETGKTYRIPEVIRRDGWGTRLDQWAATLESHDLPPSARQIVRMEGRLALFKHVLTRRIEIPFPPGRLPQERKADEVTVNLQEFKYANDGESARVYVLFQMSWPEDGASVVVTSHDETADWPAPAFQYKSGALGLLQPDAAIRREGGLSYAEATIAMRVRSEDQLVALRWDLLIRKEPDELVPFTVGPIPLPHAAPPVNTIPAPPPTTGRSDPLGSQSRSSSSVTIIAQRTDGAVLPGELVLGVSARNSTGSWGPYRWNRLPLDRKGRAILRNIAPGRYRFRTQIWIRQSGGQLRRGRVTSPDNFATVGKGENVTLPVKRWQE